MKYHTHCGYIKMSCATFVSILLSPNSGCERYQLQGRTSICFSENVLTAQSPCPAECEEENSNEHVINAICLIVCWICKYLSVLLLWACARGTANNDTQQWRWNDSIRSPWTANAAWWEHSITCSMLKQSHSGVLFSQVLTIPECYCFKPSPTEIKKSL